MSDWFVKLFVHEMEKLGLKRIPVGPGPVRTKRRKKAGLVRPKIATGHPRAGRKR